MEENKHKTVGDALWIGIIILAVHNCIVEPLVRLGERMIENNSNNKNKKKE